MAGSTSGPGRAHVTLQFEERLTGLQLQLYVDLLSSHANPPIVFVQQQTLPNGPTAQGKLLCRMLVSVQCTASASGCGGALMGTYDGAGLGVMVRLGVCAAARSASMTIPRRRSASRKPQLRVSGRHDLAVCRVTGTAARKAARWAWLACSSGSQHRPLVVLEPCPGVEVASEATEARHVMVDCVVTGTTTGHIGVNLKMS